MANFWTGFKEKLQDVTEKFRSKKSNEKKDIPTDYTPPSTEGVNPIEIKKEPIPQDPAPTEPAEKTVAKPTEVSPSQKTETESKPKETHKRKYTRHDGLLYELKIHRYNWYLLITAILLTSIFLIGLLSGNDQPDEMDTPKIVIEKTPMDRPAKIEFSINEITINDQPTGEIFKEKLIISSSIGDLKINNVSIDPFNTSLLVEASNCINKDKIVEKIDDCIIEVEWMPMTDEIIAANILIEWEDLTSLKPKVYTDIIPVSLQTTIPEPVIKEEPIEPEVIKESIPTELIASESNQSEFDPFDIREPAKKEKKANKVIKKAVEKVKEIIKKDQPKKKRKINCRKYATRAYDLNGNAIGWVRPNGAVFDHRCTKVIAKRLDNGELIGATGQKIGFEASAMQSYKERQKATLSVPQGLIDFDDTSGSKATHWASVAASRAAARAEIKANQGNSEIAEGANKHKMDDPNNVISNYLKSKVPFSIADPDQISTKPKSEEYVVRKFKPIPAVIAFPLYTQGFYDGVVPATAIVERNVYGENGRKIIIPAGSKILGQAQNNWPNTYTAFAKVEVVWDRIIRPDGAEFVFKSTKPISGDAQGKLGVPGKGTTDYLEQFLQPMVTALVPAAINMISPTADAFTRKFIIDDDGRTSVTESGEITSEERAKQEIITTWNKVATKFVEDSMKNTTPPFTVPAGTRITIFPKEDIMLRFADVDGLPAAPVGDVKVKGVKSEFAGTTLEAQNKVGDQGAGLKAIAEKALVDKLQYEASKPAPKPSGNTYGSLADDISFDGISSLEGTEISATPEEANPIGLDAYGAEVFQDPQGYFGYNPDGTTYDVYEDEIVQRY